MQGEYEYTTQQIQQAWERFGTGVVMRPGEAAELARKLNERTAMPDVPCPRRRWMDGMQ